ncbi:MULTISPECIES: PqqD family protein [Halarchaeum]|nr:PqqD family protein [Halarchaeum rubridurum]
MTTENGTRHATITWEIQARNRIDQVLFELFRTDRKRKLTLDPVGSTVWNCCNGDYTVADIATVIAEEYDAQRVEPVDETLSYFLVQLNERGLLSFRGTDR